ncbi:MAG TPA: hypothetical protein VED83_00715 [Burkholderiaceae bacterium]|nr:hypothetical protein [Burkholderiaceae bacterium]
MTVPIFTARGFATAPNRGFRRVPRLCAMLGASGCLAVACVSAPTPQVDTQAVARYRDTGYRVATERATQTYRISGPVSEAPWSASLTRPADHAVRPLIVYLPSLGQSDEEPNRWVGLWAQAGYAVLVVQALADDARVWASAEARSGDFEAAARARFRSDPMAERLARLSVMLTQIRERSRRGEPALEAIDWSEVALAGADLGAYTVQTIATAPPERLAQISWPVAPRAYLAISPFAARTVPNPEGATRAQAPVLVISSRDDVDADGIITDTSLRRLAYDRLGETDKYYLELADATHRWLGGAVLPPTGAEPATHRPAAPPGGAQRKGKHGTDSAARDSMAPEAEEDDVLGDQNPHNANAAAEMLKARSRAMTQEALGETSFVAVSTAFLDAYVRGQNGARAWLEGPAGKWLQNGDRLRRG